MRNQSQLHSSSSSCPLEGTHLEVDLPARIGHAELGHVGAVVGTGPIGEGGLLLDGRSIVVRVCGDVGPLPVGIVHDLDDLRLARKNGLIGGDTH